MQSDKPRIDMKAKQKFIHLLLFLIPVFCPAFSATADSVVVQYKEESRLWQASFFRNEAVAYRTMQVEGSVIAAVNAILLEAKEGAHIDILSPGTVQVDTADVVGGIAPLSGQTIDFHHNPIRIVNPSNLRMNGIHAIRKHGVTIKNFCLFGNVTYGVWTKGCDHFTLENLDIDLGRQSGLALFIRPRGDYRPKNFTVKGDVYINGGYGHSLEFTSVDTVTIGDLTVTNNLGGCGINASGSTQIRIGNIYGYKNCYSLEGDGGGYATLRYSNAGTFLQCNGVYSRRSGRGFFITEGDHSALPGVVGQHNATIQMVDIKHTARENILIRGENPTNNHVLSGTASSSLFTPDNPVFVAGASNSVQLGLPKSVLDTSVAKTVRINELRFGFYDLSGDEHSENYFRDRSCDGYGYAKATDELGAWMEWNIQSGTGDHRLTWRYACQRSKRVRLQINGETEQTFEFPATGSDTLWQTISLHLNGYSASIIKSIRLVAEEAVGLPLVDYLEVEAPGCMPSLKDQSDASSSRFALAKPSGFRIFPNPNTGRFTLQADELLALTPYTVDVYDASGMKVPHRETYDGSNLGIDLLHKQKGLYLLRVDAQNDRVFESQRVVIQMK